ncbi:MAG: NifB/NifX family molybdenum-iron cluster-binding protein [Candidatus Omnitrophica bacterium]|nr:NifB/NifX family molybdenum-iron cluster-binding protein [Candidatus Omnitrophota bacterium]
MQKVLTMRICIPTETDEGLKAVVYAHFGSAPYFTIYDTDKDSIEIINNTDMLHAHGACQPTKTLGAKKIDTLVCLGMGVRAVQRLNASRIKAYRIGQGTVEEVINQFKQGLLEEITLESACSQHRCH